MKIKSIEVFALRAPDSGRPHWVSNFIVPGRTPWPASNRNCKALNVRDLWAPNVQDPSKDNNAGQGQR